MFHLVDVKTTLRAIKSLRVPVANSSALRLPFNLTVVDNSSLRELSRRRPRPPRRRRCVSLARCAFTRPTCL
jgi:hypothetical protein